MSKHIIRTFPKILVLSYSDFIANLFTYVCNGLNFSLSMSAVRIYCNKYAINLRLFQHASEFKEFKIF